MPKLPLICCTSHRSLQQYMNCYSKTYFATSPTQDMKKKSRKKATATNQPYILGMLSEIQHYFFWALLHISSYCTLLFLRKTTKMQMSILHHPINTTETRNQDMQVLAICTQPLSAATLAGLSFVVNHSLGVSQGVKLGPIQSALSAAYKYTKYQKKLNTGIWDLDCPFFIHCLNQMLTVKSYNVKSVIFLPVSYTCSASLHVFFYIVLPFDHMQQGFCKITYNTTKINFRKYSTLNICL